VHDKQDEKSTENSIQSYSRPTFVSSGEKTDISENLAKYLIRIPLDITKYLKCVGTLEKFCDGTKRLYFLNYDIDKNSDMEIKRLKKDAYLNLHTDKGMEDKKDFELFKNAFDFYMDCSREYGELNVEWIETYNTTCSVLKKSSPTDIPHQQLLKDLYQ
jgi:hypothetical protein